MRVQDAAALPHLASLFEIHDHETQPQIANESLTGAQPSRLHPVASEGACAPVAQDPTALSHLASVFEVHDHETQPQIANESLTGANRLGCTRRLARTLALQSLAVSRRRGRVRFSIHRLPTRLVSLKILGIIGEFGVYKPSDGKL